ncbi:MAG: type II toxin-antitoxin system VapC family toxin [Nitrospirae bacterium]|nr:type II toxin-antitoxin system VapC family toxin [Nitrospirota bacterium]
MKKRSLLDSYAVIAYLKKEKNFQVVVERLKEAESGKRLLYMNQINAGEVYYQVRKKNLTRDFNKFWETFLLLPVEFIANDFELVTEAAKIKSRHSLSFADCFAAATAVREKAAIITGDPEFKQLEKEVEIEWI